MKILGRETSGKTVIGIVAVVLILVASTVAIVMAPEPQLSAYADDADDAGKARTFLLERGYATGSIGASPLVLDGVTDPESMVVLVLGVEVPYRTSERNALIDFVARGGNLVLADDFGYGNLLSTEFGVTFQGVPIRTKEFLGRIEVANATSEVDPTNHFQIALNDGTALHVSEKARPGGRVLARAVNVCYDNLNDGCTSASATFQEEAVVAFTMPHGEGRVVFVSDPHIFATGMLGVAGNERFLREIIEILLPSEGIVVFDESRHGHGPATTVMAAGLGGIVLATKDTVLRWVAGVSALIIVASIALFVRREEPMRQHRPDLDTATPLAKSAPAERLRAIARTKIISVHNLRVEDVTAASLGAAVTDSRMKELVASENGINASGDSEAVRDLLARIRSYGRRDASAP